MKRRTIVQYSVLGKPDGHDELLSRLKMIRVPNREDISVDVSKGAVNTNY